MSRDRIIQLQENAEELGFETIQEALDAGYHEVQDLVAGTFTLEKLEDLTDQAYREAHEDWEQRREQVLKNLTHIREELIRRGDNESIKHAIVIGDAIAFIKEGDM